MKREVIETIDGQKRTVFVLEAGEEVLLLAGGDVLTSVRFVLLQFPAGLTVQLPIEIAQEVGRGLLATSELALASSPERAT